MCQSGNHIADFIFIPVYGHPVDGVQGVVQKMRVYLSFQCGDFRIFLLFHRFFQLIHHQIELFRNGFNLRRPALIRRYPDIHIPFSGFAHYFDHALNGAAHMGDLACHNEQNSSQ